MPRDAHLLDSITGSGTVPNLGIWCAAIELDEHRIVNIAAKGIGNGFQVCLVAIGGELNAMGQPAGNVLHKLMGIASVTATNQVGQNQLGIGIDGGPSPDITNAFRALHIFGDVLLFSVNEGPDLIALDSVALQVHQGLALVVSTSRAKVNQEFGHSVDAHIRNARDGAQAAPLNQKTDDLDALGERELVHRSNIGSTGNFIKHIVQFACLSWSLLGCD